jgi:DNA polymerase III delta prime subunit
MPEQTTILHSPYLVVGHTRQRSGLAKLLAEGRLPSTLIFTGIASIGKQGVAYELAQKILCEERLSEANAPHIASSQSEGGLPPIQSNSSALFQANNHPDLHYIQCGGENGASVEQLREKLDQLNLTAFLAGKKIAILNDADNLSVVASNILLKSLEEPRPDTYFLLIAHNPTRLPQTLLSRCQRWYFDKLTPDDIALILKNRGQITQNEGDPHNYKLLVAEGSFASLETINSRPGMWEEVEDTLEAAFLGQESRILSAAQAWAAQKDSIRDRCTLLLAAIHRRLHEQSSNPTAAAIWALAIQNTIDAEYLMVERHVSPLLTFATLLRQCAGSHASTVMNYPNKNPPLLEMIGR